MDNIETNINKKIGDVRIDVMDISFGEIISLHKLNELIIQPEYQRLFRWSFEQRSRLIESILLGLPIPPVFTIENDDGVLELIDGLQRICSVIHFIDYQQLKDQDSPLILTGCDLIEDLNDKIFDSLALTLKLKIKRSSVRMIVIKKQSNSMLKYEMFKRLNTGGSLLTPQEIRNCSVRMFGESGVEFYNFLTECANNVDFKSCTQTLAEKNLEEKYDEELILRFFAAKNGSELFKRNVREWLDTYLEKILKKEISFDFQKERKDFQSVFTYLNKLMAGSAFVRHRNQTPIGSVAPAYYEAMTIGVFQTMHLLDRLDLHTVKNSIIKKLESNEFKEHIGPGSNKITNFNERIKAIKNAILSVNQ